MADSQGRQKTIEEHGARPAIDHRVERASAKEVQSSVGDATQEQGGADSVETAGMLDLSANESRVVVDLRELASPLDRWARPIPEGARFIEDAEGLVGASRVQLLVKRVLDLVLATAALVATLPLMAVIALIIRRDGPAIFRQSRVGLDGRKFEMYKFRTMSVRAESERGHLEQMNEVGGPVFKIKKDPRVTKFGYYLRRSSLDELPQLINVLRGSMSIVGPRPPLPEEVETYNLWELQRLLAKPGLTCIWQVSGRSELDFHTWVRMDVDYIADWSLGGDFRLLLATVPALISRRGAY